MSLIFLSCVPVCFIVIVIVIVKKTSNLIRSTKRVKVTQRYVVPVQPPSHEDGLLNMLLIWYEQKINETSNIFYESWWHIGFEGNGGVKRKETRV